MYFEYKSTMSQLIYDDLFAQSQNNMIPDYLKRAYDIYYTQGSSELFQRTKNHIISKLGNKQRIKLIWLNYYAQGYRSMGCPFRVYCVPVSDIKYIINGRLLEHSVPEFGILEGDWDKKRISAEKYEIMNMFKQHFEQGISWEETTEFSKIADRIRMNKPVQHFDIPFDQQSVSNYLDYLEYIDELYHVIKKDGYKKQADLIRDGYIDRSKYKSVSEVYVPHPALNEIQLMIGRDGEMIVYGGKHRLCIAKILELETIPVRTRVRHTEWQNIRERIATLETNSTANQKFKNYLKHPDVQDVIKNNTFETECTLV